jgi:hypothetical protein
MILPGNPFGSMSVEEPAQHEEEAPREISRSALDIDAVKPVGEVVFSEEGSPQVELGTEEEEQNLFGQISEQTEIPAGEDELFSGRQEQEFEYTSGPVLEVPATPESESPGSIPLILPSTEEPFGDVFEEPQAEMQWGSTSISEEDSPFGLPEPDPVPVETIEEVEAPEIQEPLSFGVPIASVEPIAVPEAELESPVEAIGFDDTWPGLQIKANKAQPVEELFESEPAHVSQPEDVEELEADLSESMQQETDTLSAAEEPQVQTAAASSAQISDEIIERIAERVLNKLSERVVSEIVWQVVPDLAEKMIRRELEKLHAAEE